MIHIKCSKCNKQKWSRVDKHNLTQQQNWACKPCRKKAGAKDPVRKPRYVRAKGPKAVAPPKEEKKKKKKNKQK